MKDDIFKQDFGGSFEFNERVAIVFDDMISRSIPFYSEFLSLTISLVDRFCADGGTIYDFGCSTATTLLAIDRVYKDRYELIGIDSSEYMLRVANAKINAYGSNIRLICDDILNTDTPNANCVISNFTFQFMKPELRIDGFKKAYEALKGNGIFIFAEKLCSQNESLGELMMQKYYEYKKAQGYSELEIMQKRTALENVLIPFSEEKNIQIAKDVGFTDVEVVFRALNFALFIAFK
jgi:tRNA (cmo5U34)-methyltransferase